MGLFGNIVSRKLINTLASAATDALGDALSEKLSDSEQQGTVSSSPAYQSQTPGYGASAIEEQPKILTSKEIAATVSGNPYAPSPEDGIKLIVDSGKDKRFSFGVGWAGPFQNFDWNISWGDGTNEHKSGRAVGKIEHEYPYAGTNYLITIKPHTRLLPGKNEVGWFQPFGKDTFAEKTASILFVDGILDDYAVNASTPNVCRFMFSGCHELRMGPNFSFAITSAEVSPGFFEEMFAYCYGEGFAVNDIFTFPQVSVESLLVQDIGTCPFVGAFRSIKAKQKRTALEIIGSTMNSYGNAAPTKPLGTFSSAFDTTGVLNENWYSQEAWQPTLS
jgi:hypothetical protein